MREGPLKAAILLLALLLFTLAAQGARAGPAASLCVSAAANPAVADGSAAHPFQKIQDALAVAVSGREIHVAQGTYYGPVAIKSGVRLLGGFPRGSFDSARRNARDLPTTITGYGGALSAIVSLDSISSATIDGFSVGNVTTVPGVSAHGIACQNIDRSCVIAQCTISRIACPLKMVSFSYSTTEGPGIYCINASPRITGCTIQDNLASNGGAIYLKPGSAPLIDNCLIRNNMLQTADYFLGSAMGFPVFVFYGGLGSAVYSDGSAPVFQNCILCGNAVVLVNGNGGQQYLVYGSGISNGPLSSFVNCTFANNSSLLSQGVSLRNCIIWGNTWLDDYRYFLGASSPVTHSCIQGWTGGGTGNIAADPQFVNAAAGDFHLKSTSPCIDAGGAVAGLTSDYDGTRRPIVATAAARGDGSHVDIGAYEYQPPPPVVTTPWISPCSGTYTSSTITVTLSCATPGAAIYYTTNGAEPSASSFLYKTPLSILLTPDVNTTIKAKAYKTGYTPSATAARSYTAKTPAVLWVDAANTVGPSDGTRHPFRTIQDAMARAGKGTQICVMQGTYYGPIVMKSGVALLGGYQRGTGARDSELYPTTLTLNLSGVAANASVNVVLMNKTGNAMLDGFRIGRVDGGARSVVGIYCAGADTTCRISKCRIVGLSGYASGFYHLGLVAPITYGSGIICNGASPQIVCCTVEDNAANYGGGIYCANGAAPLIDRCMIRNNHAHSYIGPQGAATGEGGGVFCDHASPTIRNGIIAGNTGEGPGGGVSGSAGGTLTSAPSIQNCTIVGNSYNGIFRLGGTITNCIVWGNYAGPLSAAPVPAYSCIQSWRAGGTGNISADPQFVNASRGNYALMATSPGIDAGARVAGETVDYRGVARGIVGWPTARGDGAHYDMGAFEYQLAPPTFSPAPGTYAVPLTVRLYGPAGATVRYTLDQTETTETSKVYSGPFTVGMTPSRGVTVIARSYQSGLTPSVTGCSSEFYKAQGQKIWMMMKKTLVRQ